MSTDKEMEQVVTVVLEDGRRFKYYGEVQLTEQNEKLYVDLKYDNREKQAKP
ncbi:MAG: hypothetical protein V3S43_06445 [Acidimicrobiia bacterium]